MIAQDVEAVLNEAGIDEKDVAVVDHDVSEETTKPNPEFKANEPESESNPATVIVPAVDRYSVVYNEALSLEAAYQRREMARMKDEIAELKALIANLTNK